MARFEIKGLDKLLKDLDKLTTAGAKKIARDAMKEAQQVMLQEARDNCPVVSGKLRDSINVSPKTSGGIVYMNVQTGEGDFKGEEFYGAMVEFGTKHMSPNGFMRRAADSKGEEVCDIALAKIADAVEKELKG